VTPRSLHTLLHTLVDYAGLFPPAGLGMPQAVANYASYRSSAHAWMLGRFVVPVSRLDEFADERESSRAADPHPWRLSALIGEDTAGDVQRIETFNARAAGATVDAVEVKAGTPAAIDALVPVIPRALKTYVEIPIAADPTRLIERLVAHKLRAKVRTGGVVPEAFPSLDDLGRFVRTCYMANAGFKATAGLHHPLRSERALTYEPDSVRGVMHGFLNVFVLAALSYNGLTRQDADALLSMTSLDGVEFTDDALAWKDYRVTQVELETVRRRFAVSFGSCSFREPVDELIELGLLA